MMERRGVISLSCAQRRGGRLRRGFAPLLLGSALMGSALGLTGCGTPPGSFDVQDSGQTKMNNLMAMVEFKKTPRQPEPFETVVCPNIVILDGTAEDRVFTSKEETNANLRYQFSINDTARDCQVNGNQLNLRVGVAGKLLLGPQGGAGNFTAPVRIAIVNENDQSPVVSKLYQAAVAIAPGQTEGEFSLVTEPFSLPYPHKNAERDYTVKVGFDVLGGKHKPIPEASQKLRPEAASTGGSSGGHHHHRHGTPDATSTN